MAKKKAVRGGKSEAVRNYIAAHPDAKPKEIYEALTKKGVKLSLALVNAIKYSSKSGSRKKTARRKKASKKSSGSISLTELIAAKELVESMGGTERVREALSVLDQLR